MRSKLEKRGMLVVAAGTGINLALGVLYAWSIFKGNIKHAIEAGRFDWDLTAINDPYAVCCLVFAFAMILAGKCQDKFGPRITAILGGVLVGLGFVWISQSPAYLVWVLGFGVLVGAGMAFGYASATPPALKWYPPTHTGKIAGIVVAGFGLASVYIAPLSQYLLETRGLSYTMLFLGVAFFLVVTAFASILVNPPAGYSPWAGDIRLKTDSGKQPEVQSEEKNFGLSQMVKTSSFWLLWALYFIGSGSGLMVISSVAGMAKASLAEHAFWAVATLAVGNAAGRVTAGMLSDKIGRSWTVACVFLFQAILMFIAIPVVGFELKNAFVLVLLATLIGFNYGANLTLFPSITKDLWGMKNFGVNYGAVFTAWGVGGFAMSRLSEVFVARTGSFSSSFMTAGILLLIGVGLTPLLRGRKNVGRPRFVQHLAADTNA